MSKSYVIVVTAYRSGNQMSVSESPTGNLSGDDPDPNAHGTSAGDGTPLLNALLLTGKWSIQSIQQLDQSNDATVTLIYLTKSS